jgi:protein-L-isoaspartate(D-aspartate) O-methyltransferase
MRVPARLWALVALSAWAAAGPAAGPAAADEAEKARLAMVGLIERVAEASGRETGIDRIDPRVLAAMRKVPRHRFVPPQLERFAYADTPLPLGHGQALTQPFLAAFMTHVLAIKPGDKVFETGTDTGYHAALLAEMGAEVYSVEIVEPLLDIARRLLPELGYAKVRLRGADGYNGWAEHGPYDAILVKESAVDIPPPLLRQLKPGGRMMIPLGTPEGQQFLTLVTKNPDGSVRQKRYFAVRFTPFQGGERT